MKAQKSDKKRFKFHNEEYYFALRMATAINDLRSSHSFFITQKAFGEIEWEEAEKILKKMITKCNCQVCGSIKDEVIRRFNR